MATTKHVVSATLNVSGGSGPITLDVLSGTITLDDSWSPYAQASIEVKNTVFIGVVDPRVQSRVTITTTSSSITGSVLSTATFDLAVRSKQVDHRKGTITLRLESDESLLQDYILLNSDPDTSAYAYRENIRNLLNNVILSKIGATLPAGSGEIPLNVAPDSVNLLVNPRASVNLNNATAQNATLARSTSAIGFGATGFQLNSPTSTDAFLNIGGGSGGGLRNEMQAGRTYTVSGDIHLSAPQTGTLHARARRIYVLYTTPAGDAGFLSPAAPNVAGRNRTALTFTLPQDATAASIRFYNGATAGGTVNWTNLRLSEGDGVTINDTWYFDGDTNYFGDFSGGWTGTAGASTSFRTALHGRPVDLLYWQPGTSAWAFVYDILQTIGLRLFCDVDRQWRLVPASGYTVPGLTRIAVGENATALSENIDLDDGTFYDALYILYEWVDSRGAERRARDFAAKTGYRKPKRVVVNRPYPGPGAAAFILSRAPGYTSIFDAEAVSDYGTMPGQAMEVKAPPIATSQRRSVSAVSFNLQTQEMRVTSRPRIGDDTSTYTFL